MAYSNIEETLFTYYDEREEDLIESWLEEHGYTFWRPTVCGDCCGMYEEFYSVNGICGKWDSETDKQEFIEFAKKNNIPFNEEEIDNYHINPRVES
jgi:hypothetical protein